jgi:hypothetical protein
MGNSDVPRARNDYLWAINRREQLAVISPIVDDHRARAGEVLFDPLPDRVRGTRRRSSAGINGRLIVSVDRRPTAGL